MTRLTNLLKTRIFVPEELSYVQRGVNPFHAQTALLGVVCVDVIIETRHAPGCFVFHLLVRRISLLYELTKKTKTEIHPAELEVL